eukprot:204460-Hanusia_phi.AAC.1
MRWGGAGLFTRLSNVSRTNPPSHPDAIAVIALPTVAIEKVCKASSIQTILLHPDFSSLPTPSSPPPSPSVSPCILQRFESHLIQPICRKEERIGKNSGAGAGAGARWKIAGAGSTEHAEDDQNQSEPHGCWTGAGQQPEDSPPSSLVPFVLAC